MHLVVALVTTRGSGLASCDLVLRLGIRGRDGGKEIVVIVVFREMGFLCGFCC